MHTKGVISLYLTYLIHHHQIMNYMTRLRSWNFQYCIKDFTSAGRKCLSLRAQHASSNLSCNLVVISLLAFAMTENHILFFEMSTNCTMMHSDPCHHYCSTEEVNESTPALTWAEFRRWLRWLGECDFKEPLEEEVILLMLHMLDLRDPIELGELGGECWKQKIVGHISVLSLQNIV